MIDRLTAVGTVLVVIVIAAVLATFSPNAVISQSNLPLAIQSIEGNQVIITNLNQMTFPKPNFVYNNQPVTASGGEITANGTSTYIVNLQPFQLQNARVSIQGSAPDNQAAPTILITTNAGGQQGDSSTNSPPVTSSPSQPPAAANTTNTSNPPAPASPSSPPSSSGFVTASGTHLMLDNSEYRFVGVNVYGLASDDEYNCGGNPDNPDEYVEEVFSVLEANHVNAVRFWAFQSFSHNDFVAIDRVVNAAKRHNIKLIPTLENHWADCTQGGEKTATWYDNPNAAYGSYTLSYREYVRLIVTRYRNETAILMWQLVNEAESGDAAALFTFTADTSSLIKSIDQNHLVNLGTLGSGQAGTNDQRYIDLHSLSTIDVVEAHDYDDETIALPGYPWNGDVNDIDTVAADLAVSQQLNKPFFIGEAGISSNRPDQFALFRAKMDAAFANGTVGYLIWRFNTGECGGSCFDQNDDLIDIFNLYN
ncbi:MAG: cellulase family glycosylhydrolase [Candidatus Micrarchaeota archaeon]|nr:cellulase family glycosylhydrolase [Candidatus Micrarchaeota archaeon]